MNGILGAFQGAKVLLLLVCCFGMLIFADEVKTTGETDPAWVAYRENYAKSPSGVYARDSFVYVVVSRDIGNIRKSNIQVKSLLDACRLLREYVAKTVKNAGGTAAPPLLNRRPDLTVFLQHRFPDFCLEFSIQTDNARILESSSSNGVSRFCIVFNQKDVDRFIAEFLNQPRNQPQLETLIPMYAQALAKTIKAGKHTGSVGFYYDLSACELAIAYASQDVVEEAGLSSLPAEPVVDLFPVYEALTTVEKSLTEKSQPSMETLQTWNRKLPGFGLVAERTGDYYLMKEMPSRALSCYFAGLANSDSLASVYKTKLDRSQKALTKDCACPAAFRQYADLLKLYLEKREKFPWAGADDQKILRRSWNSFGHLRFPERCSGLPAKPFEQAMGVFTANGDKDKMLELLADAITTSPNHADGWNLFGRVLMLQGKVLEAVPFFNQALAISPEHGLARANLAQCYRQLGFAELGESMALAACLVEKLPANSRGKMLEILEPPPTQR